MKGNKSVSVYGGTDYYLVSLALNKSTAILR